jgi:hypothetical protein
MESGTDTGEGGSASEKAERAHEANHGGFDGIHRQAFSEDAGERGLRKGYGVFKEEALNLNPEYAPKSVNTDGWKATMKVWAILFPTIFVICCLLHVFIKIRDRCSKKFGKLFKTAADKIWNCYEAVSKASFSQRVRRLCEWAGRDGVPDVISQCRMTSIVISSSTSLSSTPMS